LLHINRSLENLISSLTQLCWARQICKIVTSLVLGYVSSVADPGSDTFLTSVVDPHHFDPDPDFFFYADPDADPGY
jgi:hypothetical protein